MTTQRCDSSLAARSFPLSFRIENPHTSVNTNTTSTTQQSEGTKEMSLVRRVIWMNPYYYQPTDGKLTIQTIHRFSCGWELRICSVSSATPTFGREFLMRRVFHLIRFDFILVSVLKSTATEYLCDCFLLDAFMDGGVNEITQSWGNEDSFSKLSGNWLITVVGVEGASADQNSSLLYVNRLEELPSTICNLNKMVYCSDSSLRVGCISPMAIGDNVVIVGYVMKPSRGEDFAKRGAFPMCPTQNGLIFMPFTFEIPLSSQLQKVDVVLHKATDEIKVIELGSSSEFSDKITYTTGVQELQRGLWNITMIFAIDPLNNVYPVLDRLKIQLLLLGLQDLQAEGQCAIKGPHFLKAIVFGVKDFKNLSVPCPAIVQEYVNHSSILFKFYVLGEKVFHGLKKSTPNSVILMKSYERNGLKPITFDSLKSLPIDTENQYSGKVDDLDLGLVKDAAMWLSKTLDLTIFGFDVTIKEGTGDHVIVDVNYLPSFKAVDNDMAIPTFWDAIKMKFELKKMNRATTSS